MSTGPAERPVRTARRQRSRRGHRVRCGLRRRCPAKTGPGQDPGGQITVHDVLNHGLRSLSLERATGRNNCAPTVFGEREAGTAVPRQSERGVAPSGNPRPLSATVPAVPPGKAPPTLGPFETERVPPDSNSLDTASSEISRLTLTMKERPGNRPPTGGQPC